MDKDYAAYDREIREQEKLQKQARIEARRMNQMDRDIKRWEFMEKEETDLDMRKERMRQKYLVGKKGNGSAAYNPLNMEYESSPAGDKAKMIEQSRSQRSILRG